MFSLSVITTSFTFSTTNTGVPLWLVLGVGALSLLIIAAMVALVVYALRH